MAARVIPTRTNVPHYVFDVDLDGKTYELEFIWNGRAGSWSFSVSDVARNLLLPGRKVVIGLPLLGRFKDSRLPPGEILAVDTSGRDEDPGLHDLGSRVKLIYVDAADWRA